MKLATARSPRDQSPVWPHPYHGSAVKRRANRRLRRSRRTVEAVVMCSVNGVGRDLRFLLGESRKIQSTDPLP
jgi:hypothetical protein